jgi:hypothetical protein
MTPVKSRVPWSYFTLFWPWQRVLLLAIVVVQFDRPRSGIGRRRAIVAHVARELRRIGEHDAGLTKGLTAEPCLQVLGNSEVGFFGAAFLSSRARCDRK